MNSSDELLQAYTTMLLFLGSSVAMTPADGGLSVFCQKGFLRNLPVTSNNRNFREASRLLKSPCPYQGACSSVVGKNYETLFGSESEAQASPVAFEWKDIATDPEAFHLNLKKIYDRYGFQKHDYCEMSYDHLGLELLFVNMLLEKYLTEDDSEIKEMIRSDLSSFISVEMLSWLPRWAEAVADKSVTKCYTGIAGLVIGSLEDVNDLLSRK